MIMDNMSASTTPQSSASSNIHIAPENPNRKGYSCVLCAQRKVKCDRLPGGCANCSKACVPCIYKAPLPPRRRKKGARQVDTTTRLRIYENALRELGVDPESLVQRSSLQSTIVEDTPVAAISLEPHTRAQRTKSPPPSEVGVLVSGQGKSRYLENGLWTSLKSEFRETEEILEDESDEDITTSYEGQTPNSFTANAESLIFGGQMAGINLHHLHPSPVQIFKLWQLYLDNINPLVKVFHAPTVQHIISDASGHLGDLPKNVEALVFAICCITVGSLSDGDCITMFSEPKPRVIQRFRFAAQCAFQRASLLRTSDIMVLQAFTLFVLSLQNYDARIIWHFSGIAQRISQRIGLHRDGELLNLSPFDTEIRRRLWWQIMMLEGYSQKLAGTGTGGSMLAGDVKMPLNVNDSDLFSGMKETPKDHQGATETMFFLIRCHVGDFLRRATDAHSTFDGIWHRMSSSAVSITPKDEAISRLEALFQQRFLQYCDPAVPWHFMCSQLGRAVIFMMRFLAHSTEYHRAEMTQSEKDSLFSLALQVITAQNLTYTMKEMQGFMWHVNLHFQWKAFIYIIGQLRYRTSGEQVTKAWEEVAKAYEFHPSFDQELSRRALPIAVSSLTLKAWDAYAAEQATQQIDEPYFIKIIRGRQKSVLNTNSSKSSLSPSNSVLQPILQPSEVANPSGDELLGGDFVHSSDWNTFHQDDVNIGLLPTIPDMAPLDHSENMNWSSWDDLLVDFQTQDPNSIPVDISGFGLGRQ